MDCSPWGHKELDTTERLLLHFTSLPYFLFLLHFLFIFFILLLSMSYLSALSLSQIWPNKVLKHYICCTSLKKVFRLLSKIRERGQLYILTQQLYPSAHIQGLYYHHFLHHHHHHQHRSHSANPYYNPDSVPGTLYSSHIFYLRNSSGKVFFFYFKVDETKVQRD